MYAPFFELREVPFQNTPDPRFFYSTADHDEAVASLIYAVRQRQGFVLLTGEVGAGKTLVTRMMLRHFENRICFANVHHPIRNGEELLEAMGVEFGLAVKEGAPHAHRLRALHDHLFEQLAQSVPVVLVLDEAQNLPLEAFEQLRALGNLEADNAKLIQVVLVGQPELQRLFLSPSLRPLCQRLFRRFHLRALSRADTEGYIRHRLQVAGGRNLDLFDSRAIDAVHRASHGLPRLINTICDNAMLSAYGEGRRVIDGPFLESVVEQLIPADEAAGPAVSAPAEDSAPHAVVLSRASAPDSSEQIRSAHQALSSLVAQAQAVSTRVEASVSELGVREDQLQRLGAMARMLLRELNELFDWSDRVVAKTTLAAREASLTIERLGVQTHRSRKLLEELYRIQRIPEQSAGALGGEKSDASDAPVTGDADAVASTDLRNLLLRNRESLTGLCDLAGQPDWTPSGGTDETMDPAADHSLRPAEPLREPSASDEPTHVD
jgi:type II secretory pathway predicted ATPase ExeA